MSRKKAKTKLTNPDIRKVDLVDDGADQRAKVLLYKSKSGLPGNTPEEGGDEGNGIAKAAKKIIAGIAKVLGWSDDQVKKAEEAVSFKEIIDEDERRRKYREACSEIWDYCYALQDSIASTIRDEKLGESRAALIQGSIDQFAAAVAAALPQWLAGDVVAKANEQAPADVQKIGRAIAGHRMERLKEMRNMMDAMIAEVGGTDEGDETKKNKPQVCPDPQPGAGVNKTKEDGTMSKISDEVRKSLPQDVQDELARLEAVEKQAAEAGNQNPGSQESVEDVLKSLDPKVAGLVSALVEKVKNAEGRVETAEAIAKSALDTLANQQFVAKAKEFDALPGTTPDALAPVLKSLAAALPKEQYDALENVLKGANEAIKTGKAFDEIGKSGNGNTAGSAYAKIEKAADDIMKANPNLTKAQAIDKAMDAHPDLVAEYRKEVR